MSSLAVDKLQIYTARALTTSQGLVSFFSKGYHTIQNIGERRTSRSTNFSFL